MSEGNTEFNETNISPYKNEEKLIVESYAQAYFDQITQPLASLNQEQLISIMQTAEKLAQEKRETEKLYKYDRLMDKLLTRAALDDELERTFKAKEREEDDDGVLVFADVNNLKNTNDIYDHNRGDEALQVVSKTVAEGTRPGDIIGRYGGDEVIIFLKNGGVREGALVAARIRRDLKSNSQDLQQKTDGGANISFSIGIVPYRRGLTVAQVRKEADEAMYVAKQQLGKDAIAIAGLNNPSEIQQTYDYLEAKGIKAPIVSVPKGRPLPTAA